MSEIINESAKKQESGGKVEESFWESSNKELNNQPSQIESGEKALETNNPTETVPESKDLPEEKEQEKSADVVMQGAAVHEAKAEEVVSKEEKKNEIPAPQEKNETVKTPIEETKIEESKPVEKVEAKTPKKKPEANKPTPVKSSKSKKPVKRSSEEKKPQKTKEPAPKKERSAPISRSKSLPEQTTGPNLRKNRITDSQEYEKYANLLNQKTKRKKN